MNAQNTKQFSATLIAIDFAALFTNELDLKKVVDFTLVELKKAIKNVKLDTEYLDIAREEKDNFRAQAFEFAKSQGWDVDKVLSSEKVVDQWSALIRRVEEAEAALDASKEYNEEILAKHNQAVSEWNFVKKDLAFVPKAK